MPVRILTEKPMANAVEVMVPNMGDAEYIKQQAEASGFHVRIHQQPGTKDAGMQHVVLSGKTTRETFDFLELDPEIVYASPKDSNLHAVKRPNGRYWIAANPIAKPEDVTVLVIKGPRIQFSGPADEMSGAEIMLWVAELRKRKYQVSVVDMAGRPVTQL